MNNQAWAGFWLLVFLVLIVGIKEANSSEYDFDEGGSRAGYVIDNEDPRSIVTAWSKTKSPIDGGYQVWLYEIMSGCGIGTKIYAEVMEGTVKDEEMNEIYYRCLLVSGALL